MESKQLQSALNDVAESFLPDNATHKNRFEIASASSNRIYIVAQSKASNEWQCSCPGWIIKKSGKERSCKHLKSLLPILLQITIETTKKIKGEK